MAFALCAARSSGNASLFHGTPLPEEIAGGDRLEGGLLDGSLRGSLRSHVRERGPGNEVVFSVNECWHGGWLGRSILVVDDSGFRMATDADPSPAGHLPGTILPGFRDAHVHLGLVDGAGLISGGIAAVDDFGWVPEVARSWLNADDLPSVSIAGQILTVPGGYPSTSGWAPPGASFEISAPGEAAPAVDRQLDAGASFIKIALNSDVGPVFDDDALSAVVARAHERGVIVAAHAQGPGQAQRAFDAGVDRLAHAPWSERLSDELVAAMAATMSWVSTLDIHGWGRFDSDFAVAIDNVRRFHAAGGELLYGTDLGNGPLPLGINQRELLALELAGLDRDALIGSIAPRPRAAFFGRHISHIASDGRDTDSGGDGRNGSDTDSERPSTWLASARLIDIDHVKEYLT